MLELAVCGVLVLLRDAVGDRIVHLSDFIQKACLSLRIVSFTDTIHRPRVVGNERAREANPDITHSLLYAVHLFLRSTHTLLLHSLRLTPPFPIHLFPICHRVMLTFYNCTLTQLPPGVLSVRGTSIRRENSRLVRADCASAFGYKLVVRAGFVDVR